MNDSSRAPISVVLVDDDAMVRTALSMILGGAPEITVVGQAEEDRPGARVVVDLVQDGGSDEPPRAHRPADGDVPVQPRGHGREDAAVRGDRVGGHRPSLGRAKGAGHQTVV